MALIDVARMKRRLRIQQSDTTRDELVADLLEIAIAEVETFLGRVIFNDPANPRTFGAVRADYPVLTGLRVTDEYPNNRFTSIAADDFGRLMNSPEPVVVNSPGPLSSLPDYPRIEAICNGAIADYCADLYFRANSTVLTEREAGVEQSYGRLTHGLPARVRSVLKPIKQLATV